MDKTEYIRLLHDASIKDPNDILVSYDVCALFTNVPLDETIEIIAEKAFKNNWFNETHGLNLTKTGLTELLRIATKDQLFQFDGQLYEQVDGVAMGSPLGPLQTFSCAPLKNNWIATTSYQVSIKGTSTTH